MVNMVCNKNQVNATDDRDIIASSIFLNPDSSFFMIRIKVPNKLKQTAIITIEKITFEFSSCFSTTDGNSSAEVEKNKSQLKPIIHRQNISQLNNILLDISKGSNKNKKYAKTAAPTLIMSFCIPLMLVITCVFLSGMFFTLIS